MWRAKPTPPLGESVKPWADPEAGGDVADHSKTVETRKWPFATGRVEKGQNNQVFWKTPVVHKAGAGPFPDERQWRSRGSTGRGAGAGSPPVDMGRPDTLRGPVIPPEADIKQVMLPRPRMSAQVGRARRDVVSWLLYWSGTTWFPLARASQTFIICSPLGWMSCAML